MDKTTTENKWVTEQKIKCHIEKNPNDIPTIKQQLLMRPNDAYLLKYSLILYYDVHFNVLVGLQYFSKLFWLDILFDITFSLMNHT